MSVERKAIQEAHLQSSALTIGSFDGVHRGHQALIRAMVDSARSEGIPAVVLTFYPHPSVVLRDRKPSFYITSPEEKAQLLFDLGVDMVITQTFDRPLSRMEAGDFLDLLEHHLNFRHLWAGRDFALGHNRQGDRVFLEREGERRGYEFHVFPPLNLDGEIVSSTRVREALRIGDVSRVARYLGRWFHLPGVVQRGAGRGNSLGFPTANLSIWEERAYPGPGVYACWAALEGVDHEAVTNIGVRPTFNDPLDSVVVETHLLDFNGNLYGEEITLKFVDRLREERRFSGPEDLKEQINKDILKTWRILDGTEKDEDD